MINWFCFVSLMIFSVVLRADPLSRLDPHGKPGTEFTYETIRSNKECSVCHSAQRKSPITGETCFNCHNQAPHSGVAEHLAHRVKCLDCHTPHRSREASKENPGELLKSHSFGSLPEGLTFHSKPNFLIRKSCTECHQWNKLK